MSRKQSSISALAVLLSFGITIPPVVAQSTTSAAPLPKTIPDGTVVRINSSSSMMKINEALAQKFKSQFSRANIKIAYGSTDKALQSLLDGKSDVAGIGRPLTDAEKAKGLVAQIVTRNKIAMIVGKDNALKESLTINQFAQMFRGEVKDWSKVGGSGGKIRFLDRPDSSDTRKTFQNYPVFKAAPFKTGATTVKLKEDSTNAVIKELGKNGIGYAIADQVVGNPTVRVISMHEVQPDDPRYPFSQPLMYVYKGDKPSPAAQAFLRIATATENQQVVEKARTEIVKSPSLLIPFTTPTATATQKEAIPKTTNSKAAIAPAAGNVTTTNTVVNTTTKDSEFPWWVLLIPALGSLLWFVMKGLGDETSSVIAPVPNPNAVAAKPPDSRIIFTPRDSKHGYAYWEIPEIVQENLRREGKRGLKLRLTDVTDIDMDLQPANSVQEFNCNEREPDLHFPIPADNREYVAEIGYANNDEWSRVARSQPVSVASTPADTQQKTATPTYNETAQASALWGQETVQPIQATPVEAASTTQIAPVAGAASVVAVGPTLFNYFSKKRQDEANDRQVDDNQQVSNTSRIILVPRTKDSAYAYWEVSEARKRKLRTQGRTRLALRLHKVDNVNSDTSNLYLAEPIQQYECEGKDDLHIEIPEDNYNYLVELGYVKDDGSWLKVARSEAIRVSSLLPTSLDNLDDTVSPLPIEAEKVAVSSFTTRNTTIEVADTVDTGGDVQGRNGTTANGWIENAKNSFGTAVAGVGTATHTWFTNKDLSQNENGNDRAVKPVATRQCQIILVARNSQNAYAYWEVSEEYKQAARDQGGCRFMLQVHDATDLDIDYQQPHATQEYFCYDSEYDKHINIPTCDRDYIAEVGYYTDDNRWIKIIRSLHVRVN